MLIIYMVKLLITIFMSIWLNLMIFHIYANFATTIRYKKYQHTEITLTLHHIIKYTYQHININCTKLQIMKY